MPKFRFDKLVRDRIIERQIASGAKPSFRQLNPEEHKRELINKIIEETKEIYSAKSNEVVAEIADVQQALDDLKKQYNLTDDDIVQAQKTKTAKNGAFKNGCFIEYVELSEDDDWVSYYRANPDRYPEIK